MIRRNSGGMRLRVDAVVLLDISGGLLHQFKKKKAYLQ